MERITFKVNSISVWMCICFVSFTLAQNVTTEISNSTISEFFLETTTESIPTTLSVLQKWQRLDEGTKQLAVAGVNRLLPMLQESSSQFNISSSCIKDMMRLIGGLRKVKPWAFSFLDASGKFIDGLLMGTMANLGEFDQCIETVAPNERRGKNFGKELFRGKYCALDIRPPLPPKRHFYKLEEVLDELKNFSKGETVISEASKSAHMFYFLAMRIGICVPSGCLDSDISQMVDAVASTTELTIKVKRCEVKDAIEYSPLLIGIMSLFSFFGLLVLIGTLIDLFCYYTERKIEKLGLRILVCFSFVSSFKKLANTETSNETLSCFNGLRVLSITWIILGHTYLNINFTLFRGLKNAVAFPRDFAFQAIVNASVAVDTFFFMGGTLVCYLMVTLVREKNKPFSFGLYLFHRIFRILPIYSMVIAFMFLAPLLGSGPVWHDSVDTFVDACYKNWWSNLIFVNNFYHSDDMCLPQSWYVACDMQLYIAALVILLPLLRWPKIGIAISVICIVASMIGSGVLTYVMKYPPTMLFVHPDHEQRISYWSNAYFKPYSHAGPYCVGILVGYLLATKPKIRFPLSVRVVGWSLAIASNLSILYGVWGWNRGEDPTLVETILYSSCHRVAWALGVAWVVVNCATGQAGVVNYILCWKCWMVIGKLTYGAYLIHPLVQMSAVGNLRMKIQPWHFFAVWMYFGHLMITYGSAFAASMLIETPCIALEKVFLRSRKLVDDELPPVRGSSRNGGLKMNGHVTRGTNDNQDTLPEDRFVCRL